MLMNEKLHSSEYEQTIASQNMDKSHKHYTDRMKPDTKEYTLRGFAYITSKNGQNWSIASEAEITIASEGLVTGRRHEGGFRGADEVWILL